jgi:hypothetical protein
MRKNTLLRYLGVACAILSAFAVASCQKTNGASTEQPKIEKDENGLLYHILDDGSYGVSLDEGATLDNLVIPDTYKNKPVTAVLEDGFSGSSIKTATVPATVTAIGARAFFDCSALTAIALQDGLLTIGENAFYNCSALTTLTFPDTVTAVGSSAVGKCDSLTSLTVPFIGTAIGGDEPFKSIFAKVDPFDGATYMPDTLKTITLTKETRVCQSAFYRCDTLTSISLPNTVTSIESQAFGLCSELTTVRMSESIAYVSPDAFNRCDKLQYVEENGFSYLGNENNPHVYLVKADTTGVETVTLPTGCKAIADRVFFGSAIKEITFSDLQFIGDSVFEDCTELRSVYLPATLVRVGAHAFKGCNKLLIDCEVKNRPLDWDLDWNSSNRPVRWSASTR